MFGEKMECIIGVIIVLGVLKSLFTGKDIVDSTIDVADKALDVTFNVAEKAIDVATSDKACEIYGKAVDVTLDIAEKTLDVATSDKALEFYSKVFDIAGMLIDVIIVGTLAEFKRWITSKNAVMARIRENNISAKIKGNIQSGNYNVVQAQLYDKNDKVIGNEIVATKENFRKGEIIYA